MSELIAALNQLEKEKGIDKDVIMEAIENSLLAACKRDFGSADNVVVNMDRETGDIYVYAIKECMQEALLFRKSKKKKEELYMIISTAKKKIS